MVDDAAVSLEDRGVRLGHPHGGFSGPPQLFMLSDASVVSVPGSDAEAAVVDEEQAGAEEQHEQHGHPMALPQTHKQTPEISPVAPEAETSCVHRRTRSAGWSNSAPTSCDSGHVRPEVKTTSYRLIRPLT